MSAALYGDSASMLLDPPDHIGTLVEETSDPRAARPTRFNGLGARITCARRQSTSATLSIERLQFATRPTAKSGCCSLPQPQPEDASTDEPLSDTWEMDWNYHEKSIWSNPLILAEMRKYRGLDAVHALQQWKKDLISLARGEEIVARGATEDVGMDGCNYFDILKDLATSIFGMDADIVQLLIEDLLDGVETRTVAQCVLRRTRKVPENTTIRESNAGKMIADIAGEGLPVDQVFSEPLPEGGHWEKMRPRIVPSGAGAWSMIQEYWHADDFSRLNFGEPV